MKRNAHSTAARHDADARALTAGARAFDLGVGRSECPYAGRAKHYWNVGWRIRRRAKARWESYPEKVEEAARLAAPYIDVGTPPGVLPLSKLMVLDFYASGSFDADKAYANFCAWMEELRRRYRRGEPLRCPV